MFEKIAIARSVLGIPILAALVACSSGAGRMTPQTALLPGTERPFKNDTSFANLYVANAKSVTVYAPGKTSVLRSITGIIPASLRIDSSGKLYVADDTGVKGSVTVYAAGSSTVVRTITKGVEQPRMIALDALDNVYVADGYFKVYVYPAGGTQPLRDVSLFSPISLAFDPAGYFYIGTGASPYGGKHPLIEVLTAQAKSRVRKVNNGVSDPAAMAFDGSGNLYVANTNGNAVVVYSTRAKALLRTITQGVKAPDALAFDASGNLYVANLGSSTVSVYASGSSKVSSTISKGISKPAAMLFDGSGDLYVANQATVTVYSPKLKLAQTIKAGVNAPVAMVFGP